MVCGVLELACQFLDLVEPDEAAHLLLVHVKVLLDLVAMGKER